MRIRQTRQRIGSYRHDLMVALRVVNSIEKEMIQVQWEDWVQHESEKCRRVVSMLSQNTAAPRNTSVDGMGEVKKRVDQYCSSCLMAEQQFLKISVQSD